MKKITKKNSCHRKQRQTMACEREPCCFQNKKFRNKLIVSIVCVILLNFCIMPQSQGFGTKEIASWGGKMMSYITPFLIRISDVFASVVQFGFTGEWEDAVGPKGSGVPEGDKYWVSESEFEYPQLKISPEVIFANEVELLDANFITDPSKTSHLIELDDKGENALKTLREIIAGWYVTLRTISAVALLSVLLYIGIRIIISSTSGDKAKYKQMMLDWIVAFCLLFFMHYIMAISVNVVEKVDDLLAGATGIEDGLALNEKYGGVQHKEVVRNDELADDRGLIIKQYLESQGYTNVTMDTKQTSESNTYGNNATTTRYYEYTFSSEGTELCVGRCEAFMSSTGNTHTASWELKSADGLTDEQKAYVENLMVTDYGNLSSLQTTIPNQGDDITDTDTMHIKYYTNYARLYLNARNDEEYFQESIAYLVLYVALIVLTVVFGFRYMKRVIYIAFLTLMAPVVSITYPLDKVKDGQAQAWNMWLKEYLFNLLIQPLHLLLYTVLVGSAMSLAHVSLPYAVIAIYFLKPAEDLIRKFFGFEKSGTLSAAGSFAGGAMFSAMINRLNRPEEPPEKNNDANVRGRTKEGLVNADNTLLGGTPEVTGPTSRRCT